MVLQPLIICCRKINVQDIQRSQKIHQGNHEKLEREIDSRRKNVCRGENPERHHPGSCAVIICNSDDVTQLHIYEVQ